MEKLFHRLLSESATTGFLEAEPGGAVAAANAALARALGTDPGSLVGRPVSELLPDADADRVRRWLAGGTLPDGPEIISFLPVRGNPFSLRCLVDRGDGRLRIVGEPDMGFERSAAETLIELNNELATMSRDSARRARELDRTKRELETALEELKTSYRHLQKIQEFLPLCMECGKSKGDGARWEAVADYLRSNEIFLSHGSCPTCTDVVVGRHGFEDPPS